MCLLAGNAIWNASFLVATLSIAANKLWQALLTMAVLFANNYSSNQKM